MYQPPKVLYVDVDGTLYRNGQLNIFLLKQIEQKRAEGYYIALWSMRGQQYAQRFADDHDIAYLFDAILPKPGYVSDDKGWGWTKETKFIPFF